MTTPTTPARAVTDLDIVREALAEDYEILRELGRGGMAIVYKARERKLDREVAIKVLPFTLAFDEAIVERFMREARTAARLEHPHIIPIYRVGQSGQVTYIVMKLLRGQALSDRLLEHGPLSAEETRRILAETAGALAYAHRRGVVHRDVKPDNILLDEDGRCVVTDFGIARSTQDSKLTATGMALGTPRYMSPEQARAREVDGRSDIYSLGIVGYECLTGRPPFDGEGMLEILMAHVTTPLPFPVLATPEARSLYAVVERMLAKVAEDRFANADELVAALRGETAPAPPAVRDAGPSPVAVRARRRADWTGRQLAGMLLGVATLGLSGYHGGHFALRHRSRCPDAAVSTVASERRGDSATVRAPASRTFSVLVDDAASIRPGGTAEVYYDVCGLERNATFTTRITVARVESGLGRLFGRRVEPVTARFEETARGPAARRHRSIEMDGVPGGSYRITVLVTDARGRRREKGTRLRVRGAE